MLAIAIAHVRDRTIICWDRISSGDRLAQSTGTCKLGFTNCLQSANLVNLDGNVLLGLQRQNLHSLAFDITAKPGT